MENYNPRESLKLTTTVGACIIAECRADYSSFQELDAAELKLPLPQKTARS
jgi:hypothetical protein